MGENASGRLMLDDLGGASVDTSAAAVLDGDATARR
ncbi:hypothetical protein RCH07_001872 [Arthrobacter sp. CG_A4]|nr:hypothetical protein [Arthrobacter sp. CG_A4]